MRVLSILMLAGALWAQPPAAAPPKPKVPVSATAPEPVVFAAGTSQYTKSQFDHLMNSLAPSLKTQLGGDGPEARRKLADQLGEILVFASECRQLKLDQTEEVKVQLYLQRESALASVFYKHLAETVKPSEAELQTWYDAHKSEFEVVKARHILVRYQGSRVPLKKDAKDLTVAEALARAEQLRDRITKGEDFAAVAKTESDDATTGARGGDLGPAFGRRQMVPAFEQAAYSLPVGEISQPVKTDFGYHLIQVQERNPKPFDQVRAEIEKRLEGEAARKAADEFKAAHKPVLDEAYFGKPPAPVPPGPPAPPRMKETLAPSQPPGTPAPAQTPAPAAVPAPATAPVKK